ncbi:MAG: DUF2892 domain-containing protein [Methanoregula sp.]|nr:DUF2892 domain-containing protein [Methanoregula sp.]
MVKNVGMVDRVIRIILGLVLIGAGMAGLVSTPWLYIVLLIGVILLLTGIMQRCPAYTLLGFSTLEKKEK